MVSFFFLFFEAAAPFAGTRVQDHLSFSLPTSGRETPGQPDAVRQPVEAAVITVVSNRKSAPDASMHDRQEVLRPGEPGAEESGPPQPDNLRSIATNSPATYEVLHRAHDDAFRQTYDIVIKDAWVGANAFRRRLCDDPERSYPFLFHPWRRVPSGSRPPPGRA